jgi:hypothetical protein
MADEKLPLILHPGSGLVQVGPQGGRILAEMVDGALDNLRQLHPTIPGETLTAEGWFQMAEAFYYGRRTPQSFSQAAAYYRAASEMGHLDAMCNLGVMLILGLGIPLSAAEGVRHLETASASGHPAATSNLACKPLVKNRLVEQLTYPSDEARFWAQFFFETLAKCKNEPGREFPRSCAARFGLSEGDFGIPHCVYEFDKARAGKFVTFYEAVYPTSAQLLQIQGSDEWVYLLRKVRLDEVSSQMSTGLVLIVDPGDSMLLAGDLLEEAVCEKINVFLISYQGGRPARGLLCNSDRPLRLEMGHIGYLNGQSIKLDSGINDESLRKIIGEADVTRCRNNIRSFYQRGLGVSKSDDLAEFWFSQI